MNANFNTKKVRLKLHRHFPHVRLLLQFQYQKGAIKTRRPLIRMQWIMRSFQYQKGAIKTVS